MAVLSVNPTRMELNNLKQKLNTARHGHKLLNDKLNELVRQFLLLTRESTTFRESLENKLKTANFHMSLAAGEMSDEEISVAFMGTGQRITLSVEEKNIAGVKVPVYHTEKKLKGGSDLPSYGFAFTSCDLDDAVNIYINCAEDMIKLAEIERSCALLSEEIERVRRRVNALEHTIIVDYEDTIRYIIMRLQENERSTTARLMKVKDMMLEKAYNYSSY